MDVSGAREVDDPSDIKQDILYSSLNEYDDESNRDDHTNEMEQEHNSIPPRKCLRTCESAPSCVSHLEDDDELRTALQRVFLRESIQLPSPLKRVSAFKGTREKQGLPLMKLTVTWAPDVYDPLPTSVLHTVRGNKQQKSKKNNSRKKNGKKGQKGKKSSRGSKDNKQFSLGDGNSNRCYKPLEFEDRIVNTTGDLVGFNIGGPEKPLAVLLPVLVDQ